MYKTVREMFQAVYKAKYANSDTRVQNQFAFADDKFTNPSVQVEWVAFQKVLHADYISIKDVWEAAGGNPGIKACREEVLTVLRTLDEICDEADGKKTTFEVLHHDKGNLFRSDVDVCQKLLYHVVADNLEDAKQAFLRDFPSYTIYSIDFLDPKEKVYGYTGTFAIGA
ncbi:MAG: hypothetical protein WC052_05690 [Patescibacteria group bacterium]